MWGEVAPSCTGTWKEKARSPGSAAEHTAVMPSLYGHLLSYEETGLGVEPGLEF